MIRPFLPPTVLIVATIAAGAAQANDATVDFAREVLPILSNKCFVCHGPDSHDKDQLRLDSYSGATHDRGGYRAIDPSNPAASVLLERLHDAEDPMPPRDAEKQLTPGERELLTRWVKQGGKYAEHWAFVPPVKSLPTGVDEKHKSAVIDAFVLAGLKQQGLALAASADRATLARRVALTLIGLPPEPEQLANFLADKSDDAYDRYVDQLLASPRFGEHQARYWLDAVRYGDTHGLHLDSKRGIYPYRDWVVRAFNQNLPFDQFITWQLAGDLLPNPTLAQRVATGFVRMNPTTGEGGAIPAEFQAKNNFDRTETLGTVFLGMSLNCARCHTHKYDPIPQVEYYRLLAFFNSTAEHSMDGNKYDYAPAIKTPANQVAWEQWDKLTTRRTLLIQDGNAVLAESKVTPEAGKRWETSDADARLAQLADPNGAFSGTQVHIAAKQLVTELDALEKGFTTTLVAQELPSPRETKLLKRGEYNLPVGEPLQPGILTVMGDFPADAPRNRLGLARWLTSDRHPLVARVLVNRLWQRTFGHGLVRTPEDFGLQGQQPTHPELLDWLAVEFRESGWDVKHMLKLIVSSQAFRQSSAIRGEVDDPENRLFARGPSYRVDAEVLRDVALWSSGLLAPEMGGEGARPYQPAGLWLALAHPASNTKKYVADQGQRLYHRSLYVYWKRTSPHPMMTLFDAPSREASCVRRSRTNTSLQSLGLLNETQRIECARKLAERLIRSNQDDQRRIDALYRLLACRAASSTEQAVCQQLLTSMFQRYGADKESATALLSVGDATRDETLDAAEVAAWTQVAAVVLASDAAIMLY